MKAARRHTRQSLALLLLSVAFALALGAVRIPGAALAGGSFAVASVQPAAESAVSGEVVWEASTSRGNVEKVDFLVDGVLRWTATKKPYIFNGSTWDTRGESDGPHVLAVRAVAKGGGGEATSTMKVHVANASSVTTPDTTPPAAVGSLAAAAATEKSITLSWKASSDDVGVAGYGVYRGGPLVATVTGTGYEVTGLSCGTSYSLAVDAVDAAGNRSALTGLDASTLPCAGESTAASLFLSPTGSDANPCTAALRCKTLKRAYSLAKLGQTVELAAGTYPGEVISGAKGSPNLDEPDVVFRPAAGAAVRITAKLDVRVPHVEFRGMKIDKWAVRYDSRAPTTYAGGDVTFRNVVSHHGAVTSAWNVRILGGELGPNRNPQTGDWPEDALYVGAYPTFDGHHPKNFLLDGVYVHDVTKPTSTAHSDCIQFTAGENIVVRDSKFVRCEHADVMLAPDQGPVYGALFENNWFDKTLSAHYAINASYKESSAWRDVVIRYNTELQGSRLTSPRITYVGNIRVGGLSDWHCSQAKQAGIVVDWNLYTSGARCGSHDRVGDPRFRDPASFDLHLGQGSAATDGGDPASYPRADIDGGARPVGAAPDIGGDEAG